MGISRDYDEERHAEEWFSVLKKPVARSRSIGEFGD
jgi:hypothetical protein